MKFDFFTFGGRFFWEDLYNYHFIHDVSDIYKAIFKGGMPKVNASSINRDKYYSDYINTYLERDIKELSQVGKLNEFYDFLVYVAARTGQEFNASDIAKDVGVDSETIKKWTGVLSNTYIIFLTKIKE